MVVQIARHAGLNPATLDLSYSETKKAPRSLSKLPSKCKVMEEFLLHSARLKAQVLPAVVADRAA